MPEFEVDRLLDAATVSVSRVLCGGTCRHRSAEECVASTHLVFPYRGLFLRHVGGDQSVADANHVLFFNADDRYYLQLRLARALDLVAQCDDVSMLAQDLGFSSHSHFTAAFRQTYGRTPTQFRQAALARHA